MRQQRKNKQQNVTKIDNQYVRQEEQQKKARSKARFYVKRRMFLLAVISVILFGSLIINTINKKSELAEREKIEVTVTKQLEEVKQDQEILKSQVKKLEDDEYILKLARKEYFLSDEGEIIFTMPSDSKENEKENEKGSEE